MQTPNLDQLHFTETENIIQRSNTDQKRDSRDSRTNLLSAIRNFQDKEEIVREKPKHIYYQYSTPEWVKTKSIYGTKQEFWRVFPDPQYKLSGYLENWNRNPQNGEWLALGINSSGYCYVGQHTDIQEAIYQMVQFEELKRFESRQNSIKRLGYAPI